MKKFIYAILALALVPSISLAAQYSKSADKKFVLNQGFGASTELGTEVMNKKVHALRAQYDFTVSGGAVGAISLLDVDGKPAKLPNGAVIVDCLIDVVSAPASTTSAATIALGTGLAADDLKTATVIGSYTGLVACIPVGTAATAIKMTAEHTPKATIATAALTGGKFNLLIQYILGE